MSLRKTQSMYEWPAQNHACTISSVHNCTSPLPQHTHTRARARAWARTTIFLERTLISSRSCQQSRTTQHLSGKNRQAAPNDKHMKEISTASVTHTATESGAKMNGQQAPLLNPLPIVFTAVLALNPLLRTSTEDSTKLLLSKHANRNKRW
jgi:hypothetical protein